MADELERARKARDAEKKDKKKRELPKDFKRKNPDDLIDMINEVLTENERVINAIDRTEWVREGGEGHGSAGSED